MAVKYQLASRVLTADDQPWLERFAVGEEWWSHELTDFVRNQALEDSQQRLSSTTLFSFPGLRDIVGFCTAASGSIPTDLVREPLNLAMSFTASRVPAILIPYLGVARQYRRIGHFGQEIHLQLLEALLPGQWAAFRLIYVECWRQNEGGAAFWQKLGYEKFGQAVRPHPETDEPEYLDRYMYDMLLLR